MTRKLDVPAACPACGAPAVAFIAYGEPVHDIEARFAPTPVVLGGCCIWAEAPRWHCLACDHAWGRAFERPAV